MFKIYKNMTLRLSIVFVAMLLVFSCDEEGESFSHLGGDPRTITEIITDTPELSSLLQSLQQANLNVTFNEETTFTLFAPVNSAFSGADLSGLTDEELEQLLLYHTVNTTTADFSKNLETGYISTMALGPDDTNLSLFINKETGFNVNGIADGVDNLLDMAATNGVIHAIDGILAPPTIFDHVKGNPSFSMFWEAVEVAGLDVQLSSNGSMTVFAPTNAAFESFMLAVQNDLGYNSFEEIPLDLLTQIIEYHIIDGNNASGSLAGAITTQQGETLNVDGTVIADQSEVNANILIENVQGVNGMVHAVDKVLLPNSAVQVIKTATLNVVDRARDAGYTVFADAVEVAGLTDAFTTNTESITVFIPTNEALQALFATAGITDLSEIDTPEETEALNALLNYHVVSGFISSSVLVNGMLTTLQGEEIEIIAGDPIQIQDKFDTPSVITSTDIAATNGIIHVVDDVLVSDQGIEDYGLNIIAPPIFGFEIYTDAPLINNLTVASDTWAGMDYNVANKGTVKTGSTAIRQTFADGWTGFQLNVEGNEAGAMDITGNSMLKASFYLPEGSTGATVIRVILNDNYATFPTVNLVEGEWVDVELPLSDFGNPTEFWQFAVQIEGDPITLFMDDIGFDETNSYTVYSEGDINTGWSIGGWGNIIDNQTYEFGNLEQVYLGFESIKLDFDGGAWSAFNYQADSSVDISGYTTLKVAVYAEESGQQVRIALNGNFNDTDPYQLFKPLNAGEWNYFEIPLTDIGTPTEFTAFGVQYSGGGVIYIDNVAFN
ncbi:fasciclin domain-containing protein [Abyssalbus ytuae]|uniref:Fasciclin domain-containing protein n=1 Tax=Abyssalbus ytuae TaxID=2926907 RepID=A0A9E6ZZJ1_9FLAO|nr:fasciclin domain-containing protein [Abyssalbus ytuae]UOB16746.1 fasciclin domain-containing protein [Abyssalbus ytuae]